MVGLHAPGLNRNTVKCCNHERGLLVRFPHTPFPLFSSRCPSIPSSPAVWVIVLANALVFIHMLSAVQLFTQPLFAAIEHGVARRWPASPIATSPRITKLVWRSLYIAFITFISALIPFFSQIIGLVGAVIYWPTAILFPVFVWLAVFPPRLSVHIGLQTLNAAMLIVALLAIVGSLRSIINNADTYGVFQ